MVEEILSARASLMKNGLNKVIWRAKKGTEMSPYQQLHFVGVYPRLQ